MEDLDVDETKIQFDNKVHYDDDIQYNTEATKRHISPSKSYKEKRKSNEYIHEYHHLRKLPSRTYPSEIFPSEHLPKYHIKANKTPIILPHEKSNIYRTSKHKNHFVSLPNGIRNSRGKDEYLYSAVRQNEITERTDESSGIMILQVLLNIVQFIGIVFNSAIGKL